MSDHLRVAAMWRVVWTGAKERLGAKGAQGGAGRQQAIAIEKMMVVPTKVVKMAIDRHTKTL